jgi:alpha-tubulin suppressor-like RCC1 family protein
MRRTSLGPLGRSLLLALAAGCVDRAPTAPELGKQGTGLKVTPGRLSFTAIGASGTLTASTTVPGGLTAVVSTPGCVAVSPRRVTRSPGKFTVTATAAGTCSVTITDGALGSAVIPVRVVPAFVHGTLTAGDQHTCGLTSAGAAYCWGSNRFGQLGSATNSGNAGAANPAPLPVQGSLTFTSLSAGQSHTCGLTPAGVAYCWGANDIGQLGVTANIATGNPNPQPTAVNTSETFIDLQAGRWFTCGLKSDGAVLCWGSNQWGQIGSEENTGGVTANPAPNQVLASVAFTSLYAGDSHTCALTAGGDAYCWGRNNFGQLGTALNHLTGNATPMPQAVSGDLTFTSLAAGRDHTCGLASTGATYCWGNNDHGAFGTTVEFGTGLGYPAPLPMEGSLVFTALAAGDEHTCGLLASGDGYCWGRNSQGKLGSVTDFFTESTEPLLVDGGFAFIQLSTFGNHTCGVTRAGSAYCWGRNEFGQLGTTTNSGTFTANAAPLAVSGGFAFATP